jgi:hypothetical protein
VKVIKPTTVMPVMLVSTNTPELDSSRGEVEWSAATIYSTGSVVARASTRRLYRRIGPGGSSSILPEIDPNWKDIQATNRWAAFDQSATSQTKRASPLDITVAAGVPVTAVALLQLAGASATITATDGPSGPVIYSRTVNLTDSSLTDWFAYFYEPFRQREAVVLTDLPPYLGAHVRLQITGPGEVACGAFILGAVYSLGETQMRPRIGIRDYSRKAVDEETGIVTLEQRAYARRLGLRWRVPDGAVDAMDRLLSELRATPCVWIGDEQGLQSLTVFGWFRDYEIDVAYRAFSYFSAELEGMT